MNRIIIIWILIIFIWSQTEASCLNLKESIKLALANNKTIIEEPQYNLKIKSLERISTYKDYMPQLKTNFSKEETRQRTKEETNQDNYETGLYWSYIFNNGLKFNSEVKNLLVYDRISQKSRSTLQASIELPLPLTEGKRLNNLLSLKAVDEGYQLSQIGYELAEQQLILECSEKYFALCKANRDVRLAEEQLNLTKQLLKLAEARFKLGEISEVDKMQVEVELALHEDELSEMSAQKKSSIREFLRVIGISHQIEEDIIIEKQIPVSPEIKYELSKCIEEAFDNRLEIKTQEVLVAQGKRNIIITKTKNKPDISLSAQAKHSSKEEKEFEQSLKEYPDRSWEIKFIFNYPFFDSQKTKTEIQKANITYESDLARLERLKENIADEIFLIYNKLESLKHRLKNLELNLKLSEQTLKMNQMKYKLGKTSSREVIESQLSYFKVKSNYEDVRIDFIINYLRLLKAMGISLKEYIFSLKD